MLKKKNKKIVGEEVVIVGGGGGGGGGGNSLPWWRYGYFLELHNEILWTFLRSQSKSEKNVKLDKIHLSLFTASLWHRFPSFIPVI